MILTPAFSINRLCYLPDFLSEEFSNSLYQQMLAEINWAQPELVLFGKKCPTPRLVGFAADEGISYQYSGYRHLAQQWPSLLKELRQKIQAQLNEPFNSALCNLYRNGQDYMGWHTDNESVLGKNPCVASVSLGAVRDFKIRNKTSKETFSVPLASGSLLVMERGFQETWQHALPKRTGCSEHRLNVTFRNILKS